MSDPAAPPVRLRGHHLLCVLTFVGKGYSPGFVAAMAAIVERLPAALVEVVDGPDDICSAHLAEAEEPHCLEPDAAGRDLAALDAVGRLLGLPLAPGARLRLDPDDLARLRAAFASGRVREACAGCSWEALCTAIAASGFSGTRLFVGELTGTHAGEGAQPPVRPDLAGAPTSTQAPASVRD